MSKIPNTDKGYPLEITSTHWTMSGCFNLNSDRGFTPPLIFQSNTQSRVNNNGQNQPWDSSLKTHPDILTISLWQLSENYAIADMLIYPRFCMSYNPFATTCRLEIARAVKIMNYSFCTNHVCCIWRWLEQDIEPRFFIWNLDDIAIVMTYYNHDPLTLAVWVSTVLAIHLAPISIRLSD